MSDINARFLDAGDPIRESDWNTNAALIDQLAKTFGSSVTVGPGGLSFGPNSPFTQENANGFTVTALGGEVNKEWNVGQVVRVQLANRRQFNPAGPSEPTEPTVVMDGGAVAFVSDIGTDGERGHIGIISSQVSSFSSPDRTSVTGTVILNGVALARLKRPVGFPEADDTLLQKFGVGALLEGENIFEYTFGKGVADVLWEEKTWEDGDSEMAKQTAWQDPHWAVVRIPAQNPGAVLIKSTAEEVAGEITFKFMDKDEAVRGAEHTLPVVTVPPCE